MAIPRESEIMLRFGWGAQKRAGVWVVGGAGRGRVEELKEVFTRADATTCATYIDRDGTIRLALPNIPRPEWVDLDGDGIRETPGFLFEGSRSNAWLWSDDQTNVAWLSNGLSSVVGGDPDPMGGTTACHTVENGINTSHIVGQNFASATDNTRQSITWHAAKKERTWAVIRSFPKDGVAKFSYVNLATGAKGTIDPSHDITVSSILKNGFYRITMSFDAKSGASTPSAWIGGATGDGGIIFVGDGASGIYVWRGQHEKDVAFASSPIKTTTAAVTRAADSLVIPFNWGTTDLTLQARLARPVWADAGAAVDIGGPPGIFQFATGAIPQIRGGSVQAARQWYGYIDTAVADSNFSTAILAGMSQIITWQFKNLASAGQVAAAADIAGGFGAFASAATGFLAYGGQTLRIGGAGAGQELYGVLIDFVPVRGLFLPTEMLAAA